MDKIKATTFAEQPRKLYYNCSSHIPYYYYVELTQMQNVITKDQSNVIYVTAVPIRCTIKE